MSGSGLVWTYAYTVPSGDTTNAVSITATDIAGNPNAAATGVTSFIVDNTPPTISSASAVESGSNPNLTVTADDGTGSGVAQIRYWAGDTSEATAIANSVTITTVAFSSPVTLSISNGPFGFVVVDAAGNESTLADTFTYSSPTYTYDGQKSISIGQIQTSNRTIAARGNNSASSRTFFTTPVFTDPASSQSASEPDQAAAPSKAPSAAMQPVSYNYSTTGATRSAPVDSSGLSLLQRTNRSTTTTGQAPAMPVRYAGTPASAASSSRTAGTSGAPASETAVNARAAAPTAAGLQTAAQGTSTSGSQASASAPAPTASGSSSSQGSASAPVKGASPAGQKTPAPVNNSVPRPDLFVGQARQRRDEASEESWDDEE